MHRVRSRPVTLFIAAEIYLNLDFLTASFGIKDCTLPAGSTPAAAMRPVVNGQSYDDWRPCIPALIKVMMKIHWSCIMSAPPELVYIAEQVHDA